MKAEARVVLLAGSKESSALVYNFLKVALPITAVVIEGPGSRADFLKRRIRRLGWFTVLGQVAFQTVALPILRRTTKGRSDQIKATAGLDESPIPGHLVHHVSSANALETSNLLKQLAPQVIVVNGSRILSKALLDEVPANFINMHAGITPLFRGVHGGYWALATGRADACGVTVHLVDAGIDTGGVLAQACIVPTPQDNFATYPLLQLAAGLPHLQTIVEKALEGRLDVVVPPDGVSKLWSHPTLWGYAWRRLVRGTK